MDFQVFSCPSDGYVKYVNRPISASILFYSVLFIGLQFNLVKRWNHFAAQ